MRRLICVCSLAACAAMAAGGPDSLDQATGRLEELTGKAPAPIRIEFRMRAAEALAAKHPELARKFVKLAVAEINSGSDLVLSPAVFQAFAVAAPADGVSIVPHLAHGQAGLLVGALARAGRSSEALAMYRQSLARGDLQVSIAGSVLTPLAKQNPAEAEKLFRDMLATAHFESLDPYETYRFLDAARIISPISKSLAVEAADRIAATASAPDYGAKSPRQVTAVFQGGPEPVNTTSSRDTLLLASAVRLKEWAPEKFEARKALFERWNLSTPLTLKSLAIRNANGAPPRQDGPDAAISKDLGQMRGLPTDADRARLVLKIVGEIRELPSADARVRWASSTANLSTEGDLGKEALGAVASTLAEGLQQAPASTGDPYLELASLVRYEHLPAPKSDPALDAASALLTLRHQLLQETDFTLTGLDGKQYSLSALRGKVVLLNFWATWCPPCRKEMPDMETLYQRLQAKGFVVLAVSDEDRDTVAGFEDKQKYTFPILLDPERKVNTAFNVEGIPKSFLFDREGKLVAQAIDMRTERQFLEMLKQAGM